MKNENKIKYAIRIAKRINERYRDMERKNLQYYSYAYEEFKKDKNSDFKGPTGYYTQSKKRLESFTNEQLDNYINVLERQEKAKSTKVRNVRKVREQSYDVIKNKLKEVESELKTQFDIKDRDTLVKSGILAIKEMDSTQIIEDWLAAKSNNISIEDFIAKYKEYEDKFTDERSYTRLKRELQKLGKLRKIK